MIERVLISEKNHAGDVIKAYGYFDFAALPRLGERIVVGNQLGGLDILRVDYVEHSPVMTEPDTYAERQAKQQKGRRVTVFVQAIDVVF